ncbi:MAG: PEP-utilizing enzyme, partial [Pirellulales bacterium]
LGRRVAEYFDHPCDIEWGWADGQPALLQARAIKGLELAADLQDARSEERQRLQALGSEIPTVWVLHNLAETLPAPTPLTADLMRRFLSARGGFGQLYRLLGFTPLDTPHSLLEIIGGRPYLDPRRAAELFFGDLPLGYDLDRLAVDAQLLDGPPQRIEWERASTWFFLQVPRLLAIVWRAARREQQLASSAVTRFQQHVVRAVDRFLAETRDKKLPELDDGQLAAEWQRRRDWVLGELAAESLLPGYLGGLAFARLRESLIRIAGPVDGALWSTRLTAGLPGDVTVEQNDWLWQVAQGQRSLDEFLTRFGHRAAGEMELAVPRWCDDPSYVMRIVDQWRTQSGETPAARHAAQEAAREAAEREWTSELARYGASSLREDLWVDLRRAQQLLPYREAGKFQLLRAYATLRDVACEWGRRWQLGEDVFYLAEQELVTGRPARESCADQVRRRRLRWQSCQKLGFPERIDSRRLEELDHGPAPSPQEDATQGTLAARPLSAGIVEGTARHVLDPRDGTALPDDCILICPSTDPGWTPLFVRIRGLIVERGGALSHGAIVARDFGIPAVACERALARIPDGARIRLDAERGEVRIMGATP